MPITNKTNKGKSIKDVSLNITRKRPISAGPINAAAFPKVLNNPKNAPALSDGINLANKLRELP